MKTKLLILLLLCAQHSWPQWTRITAIPTQQIVGLTANEGVIYALSGANKIYSSANSGTSWSEITVSQQAIDIVALTFFNDKMYVGTYTHGIFSSADQGSTWQQDTNNTHWITGFAIRQNQLYAATLGHGVIVLDNVSGAWWNKNNGLPMAYSASVNAIANTSDYLCIDAGANGTFYRYDFTADQWIEGYYVGVFRPGLHIDELMMSGNTLFAVGGRRTYRTSNAATSWIEDNAGTHTGTDRNIYEGTNDHYLITNTFDGQNGSWLQKRSKQAAAGSSWATGEEYLAGGYAYDIIEWQNKLFLAKSDGLYVKDISLDVEIPQAAYNLRLFPNPSDGLHTNVSADSMIGKFSVYNQLGQLVGSETVNAQDFSITSNLSSGCYWIAFDFVDGLQVSKKLLVR